MFFNSSRWRIYKWMAIGLVALFIIGNLYALFTRRQQNTNIVGLLIFGLITGGALAYFIFRANRQVQQIRESSHTVVESMKKVFKIVCAEGQFNELYDYEETRKFLSIIPSTKKALVIVKAKVLIGFDFEKCRWETNEETGTVRLLEFPEAEILSVESDYKYYNIENGLFNKFDKDDLTIIQAQGKKQIEAAAKKSDLPAMAAEQMKTVLTEVLQSKNWRLANSEKILIGNSV